ncbi:hypothetical protein CAAN1_09S01002 [[Candida] anglica]|uniref:RING-type domain-containing protein n=1 Tax=[Candida] anglica TaxID=148631 RepID=A0ABP0EAN2_9ASCO
MVQMSSSPITVKQDVPRAGRKYPAANEPETNMKTSRRMTSRRNQVSINHLLDFQSYEDSEEYQNNVRRRRNSNNGRRRGPATARGLNLHGMAYVNCHYKFVVDHRSDYTSQLSDPNVPVKGADIVRIITPRGKNACPICLSDDPVAPRMLTSCGHILCLACLLSLLESEVPRYKKKEAAAIVEKYRECPLCLSVIRKNDIKPVLISTVDERFEVPKVGDEVVLTLMSRSQDKACALPRSFQEYHGIEGYPWVKRGANNEMPDFGPYSRILLGDLDYIIDMYKAEEAAIMAQHEEEKLLYNDDGKFAKLACEDIENDMKSWIESYKENPEVKQAPNSIHQHETPAPQAGNFYFYQTGFNAQSAFFLSALDIKVLRTTYSTYENLPSNVIAKIENIRYEELTPELATTRYKYLSHLAFGTTIGFLECNWFQNEYISHETWETFKLDLNARSKQSQKKFKREEKNKQRALNDEELRAREFYERENGAEYATQVFSGLTIEDLPVLSQAERRDSESSGSEIATQRTVWGTDIPKSETFGDYESGDDWDAEEMIRKAKEEMDKNKGNGKKKKKRIVLTFD